MTTPLRKTRLFAHETVSLDKVAADAGDLYYDKGLNTLRLFTKDTYTYGTAAAVILATRAWVDVRVPTSPVINTGLVSGTSSFNLLNTTATTINFGGAADTITMGSGDTGSIVTINSGMSVDLDTELNGALYVGLDTELNGLLNVGMGSEAFAATSGLKTYSIISASRTDDIVTLTTSIPHTLVSGQIITVGGGGVYFGASDLEVLTIGSNTLTYSLPGTNQPNTATSATLTTVPGYTNLMAHFHIDADDYAQIAVHNMGNGIYSSTDIIAYASQGDDYSGYIDMGITNENFDDPSFTITGKNDGYIFMEAPQGTLGEGNLVLATGSRGTANKIVFAAGGLDSNSTQMEIIPDESVMIHIPTESTSPTTGALVVDGGVGIFGNLNVQGATTIVGTLSFGGGTTTADNLAVADPLIFTGNENTGDLLDLGILGEYSIALSLSKVINNKALTSNVATLTTSTLHTLLVGDRVTVDGVDATFDGTVRVTGVPTTSTFTYSVTAEDVPTVAVSPTGTLAGVTRRKYGGMLRDASDGIIKFYNGGTSKPTTTIDFGEAGLAYAPLQIGALTCTTIGATTITAVTINETSSITLKQNLNPIVNGLDKVLSLKGWTYDRKDGSTTNEVGLLAEEVYAVIPQLVTLNDKGDPYSIQYTKLTAYLIEAIKDLKAELNALKKSIQL